MKKSKDYEALIIKESENIFKAMKKLNDGKYKFQIVVGEKSKFIGTITDGDIRRGLLRGLGIDSKILECVNKKSVFAYGGNLSTLRDILNSISSVLKFLPILNKDKTLDYVLIDKKEDYKKTALVMAGGFGKRLGDKIKNIPKPLLKVGKKTILENILGRLEAAKFELIYVSSYYLHSKIEQFLEKRNSKTKIRLLIEDKPLGTAGSINLVPKDEYETLTVVNGDILTDINYNSLLEFHNERANDITFTVARYDYQIPFGVVELSNNIHLREIREKPLLSYNILSGIYCLKKNACELADSQSIDMPEILTNSLKLKKRVEAFPIYEYWKDVGSPIDLELAISKFNLDKK